MHSEDTVRIPLLAKNGSIRAYALVDAVDANRVSRWTWRLSTMGYAVCGKRVNGVFTRIAMHRIVMGLEYADKREVDHMNRDKLDNRRTNLRIVSHAGNMQNVRSRGGSSAYRGVHWNQSDRRWNAGIRINGRRVHIGNFTDEHEAGRAAEAARQRLMPFAND